MALYFKNGLPYLDLSEMATESSVNASENGASVNPEGQEKGLNRFENLPKDFFKTIMEEVNRKEYGEDYGKFDPKTSRVDPSVPYLDLDID